MRDETYFRLRGWIPIPLYVATALFATSEAPESWELAVGLACAGSGVFLRCAARLKMGRSSDTRRLHSRALVTDGIYAWTRNPIYLGNLLAAVGLAVLAGARGYAALLGAALCLHYLRVIVAEEHLLEASFPVEYAEYRSRVPRLLPRRLPAPAREGLSSLRREARIAGLLALSAAAIVSLRLL